MRGLHRFALRDGLVDVDVAHEVRPPAAPRRLPKAISVDDVERLLDAAGYAGTSLALRDRALLELLYATGARISEAVGLAVDDVDLADRTVLLTGKGGKQRRVPLGSFAARAVEAYLVQARPGSGRRRARHADAVPQLPRRPAVAAVGLGGAAHRGRAGRAGRPGSRRTRCGTRSPPT